MAQGATRQQVVEPEQLSLFDGGPDVGKLRQKAALLSGAARAVNTQRAYASDWAGFSAWCATVGRANLPAKPETVRLALAAWIDDGRACSTLARRVAAIVWYHEQAGHPSPLDAETRAMLAGARRSLPPPKQKAAITPAQLRRMVANCDRSPLGVRNHALLLFGFATGLRRSEISAVNLSDVQVTKRGLVVRVLRSKTDQESKGREFGVFPGSRQSSCPVRWMSYWLRVRGKDPGPLFTRFTGDGEVNTMKRLGPHGIAAVVRAACAGIGLDPRKYGAHSLRAGMVTAAAEAGASELAIMQVTGHRSVQTLARYVRPASPFGRANVLAKAL